MAEELYRLYCDPQSRPFMLYVRNTLSEVQAVNKTFQAKTADPTLLNDGLERLVSSLGPKCDISRHKCGLFNRGHYTIPGFSTTTWIRGRKSHERRDGARSSGNCNQRLRKFTVLLLEEIKHRLPENFAILKKVNTLSARHALTPSKPSIVELAEAFVTSAEEIGKIERQWQNLPYVHWQNVDNTEKLWTEVHLYRDAAGDNPFKELCNLALTVLALPHSNADVERVFSQLNIVKNKLRNRLSLGTVNSILHIRYGLLVCGKSCWDYRLPRDVIQKVGTMTSYEKEKDDPNEDVLCLF
ncbi:uncharacterized protein LOC131543715 [Onychostoma macrolepis]|uniref:uncharacterized protein LOC131543715 n=1 Tax=Onychostoma macrolepis TaxID=369639 RepID=UPI00272C990D|nr:uncharacterized protein LOC131543715 [Onychostoma macrolepis]